MKRKSSFNLEQNPRDENDVAPVSFNDIMVMLNNNQGARMIEVIENKTFQDINLKNDDSILMRASELGDVEAVRYLLDHGADITFESFYSGHSALSLACLHGHESIAKLLLDHNDHPDFPLSQRPLVMASRNGHIKVVELLLDNGADIDIDLAYAIDDSDERAALDEYIPSTHYRSGPTALMTACMYGHIDLVRFLLQRGAKTEPCKFSEDENEDMAPVTFASRAGHWDIVKLLLEHGLPLEGKRIYYDDDVSTPLMYACAEGNLEVVKMLLDLGATINTTVGNFPYKKYCDSPLLSACLHGHAEVVKFILGHEKFVASDNNFDHALIEAYESGSPEVITLLQSYISTHLNADLFQGPEFLNRMLIEACKAGRAKAVKTLLAMGASVDATGSSGRTALMETCASERAAADLIPLLVEHGADVNKVDSSGNTPLMIACKTSATNALQVGKLLLKYGADVTVTNNAGRDVFYLCEKGDKVESHRFWPFYRVCKEYKESGGDRSAQEEKEE